MGLQIRRTSSDYVGVRDILQSFGLLFGFDNLPDHVNPEDFHDDSLKKSPMNIYCIGGPKANHRTRILLAEYHERLGLVRQIRFCPNEPGANLRNVKGNIKKDHGDLMPGGWDDRPATDRRVKDSSSSGAPTPVIRTT
ncbi:MAG: hypothetical protein FJ128_06375 [Deltaproteobacteria bacterium]|nr:hypothetical protein [Deltaproteobacteria bacterium]